MLDRAEERIKMLVSHDPDSLELLGCIPEQFGDVAVFLYEDRMPQETIAGYWLVKMVGDKIETVRRAAECLIPSI
jgi:hypothetical protein